MSDGHEKSTADSVQSYEIHAEKSSLISSASATPKEPHFEPQPVEVQLPTEHQQSEEQDNCDLKAKSLNLLSTPATPVEPHITQHYEEQDIGDKNVMQDSQLKEEFSDTQISSSPKTSKDEYVNPFSTPLDSVVISSRSFDGTIKYAKL